MKLKLHFVIVAMIAVSFVSNAQVSDNESAARKWIQSHAKDLNIKGDFDSNETVTIYNMLGQTVLRKAVTTNDESIDVTSLAKGIYNVYFNNVKVSYKFIKE